MFRTVLTIVAYVAAFWVGIWLIRLPFVEQLIYIPAIAALVSIAGLVFFLLTGKLPRR